MKAAFSQQSLSKRNVLLDLSRGSAVWLMILYHFAWNLNDFGIADIDLFDNPIWFAMRTFILFLFLLIAGISMVLAHGKVQYWRAFWRRWIAITTGAAIVSFGTLLVMPQVYVFFGVLHCIALTSLLAFPFLKTNLIFTVLVATLFVILPTIAADPLFNQPLLQWTGLVTTKPESIDYVPIFPWAGIVLFGIACCRWHQKFVLIPFHDWCPKGRVNMVTQWVGRNALLVYLLHQPVLVGLVWLLYITIN